LSFKIIFEEAMYISNIEHIGIAVKNLNETIRYYEDVLGLKCYSIEEVEDQKVKTAFFKVGGTKIELLESMEKGGPIDKFIEKRGEGVHHIAFAVKDIRKSLKEIESKGIELINKEPISGAENFQVAFLHPKSTFGVLTEFCEHNK
jgi:methylmalonyl-CoA/ethylmalonyl-CoA epimerase